VEVAGAAPLSHAHDEGGGRRALTTTRAHGAGLGTTKRPAPLLTTALRLAADEFDDRR